MVRLECNEDTVQFEQPVQNEARWNVSAVRCPQSVLCIIQYVPLFTLILTQINLFKARIHLLPFTQVTAFSKLNAHVSVYEN